MKYVFLAAVLFLLGVGITQLKVDEHAYVPTVRVRTETGLFMTVVQTPTSKRSTCADIVGRLVSELERTCSGCSVESNECQTVLSGMERALASGAALPVHTIAADGVRIAMLGAPKNVNTQCRTMAAKMAENGLPGATCVLPTSSETGSEGKATN